MAKGCADSLITNLFDDLLAENSLLLRYYFGVDKKLRWFSKKWNLRRKTINTKG